MCARIKVRCQVNGLDEVNPLLPAPHIVVENDPIWTNRVRLILGDGSKLTVLGADLIQAIRNAMNCDGSQR